jgi:hypothetical protein
MAGFGLRPPVAISILIRISHARLFVGTTGTFRAPIRPRDLHPLPLWLGGPPARTLGHGQALPSGSRRRHAARPGS